MNKIYWSVAEKLAVKKEFWRLVDEGANPTSGTATKSSVNVLPHARRRNIVDIKATMSWLDKNAEPKLVVPTPAVAAIPAEPVQVSVSLADSLADLLLESFAKEFEVVAERIAAQSIEYMQSAIKDALQDKLSLKDLGVTTAEVQIHRPKVVVVGRFNGTADIIQSNKDLVSKLKVKVFNTTTNAGHLRTKLLGADHVVVMTQGIGHDHFDVVQRHHKGYINVNGGMTELKAKLGELAALAEMRAGL